MVANINCCVTSVIIVIICLQKNTGVCCVGMAESHMGELFPVCLQEAVCFRCQKFSAASGCFMFHVAECTFRIAERMFHVGKCMFSDVKHKFSGWVQNFKTHKQKKIVGSW